MKVKELLKTVNVAWSPPAQHPILLAAGTAAQQLDASFNTSASLDLYSLNLQQPGYDMELKASVSSDHRFYKIIWGSYGNNPAGIIVGGCDYGTIKIYSASKLLSNESDCLISSPDRHTGPVRAMDFNPFQANLLATGATESEIYIWDIVNTSTPMAPGSRSQPLEDVQHIAWNKQVQHILASTFSQRCVIWDLRKNEPIIKLTSTNSKVRWKVVQWHPEVATQLCLASEDDQAPVIELWDLRFATSPLKTFQDHQRGVLSIAWNPHDSDLLLSCAKDNRILCWNPSSEAPNGEVVCELAQTNQWNFDVSWCPRYPGLVVGTSFDGHAAVYSLLGGQYQASAETSNKIVDSFPGMDPFTQPPPTPQAEAAAILTKPPKWLRKPSGASFGFGGKLITFDTEPIDPNQPSSRKVIISQVITQPDLIKRSNELEEVLKTEQYKDYCQAKIDVANDEHMKNVWSCVDAYFNENLTKNLMSLLGYNSDEINNKLNQLAPPQDIVNDVTEGVDNLLNGNVDGTAAFDAAIAQYNTDQQKKSTQIEKDFQIDTSDDEDGLITQAILLGNLEAAVSLCFKSKRYADAIILSMAGGADLLARTQYRYFAEHSGALNALINSLVSENWIDIVKNSDIRCWKKVLVGIFTHSNPPERFVLCDMLGDRLFACDDPNLKRKSQICYICSGNLNKMIEVTESGIQEIVELVIIMQKALEAQGIRDIQIEGNIARVLTQYAEMLASEGNLETALGYLSNSRNENVIMLKDRLCRALGYIEEAKQNPAPMNIHKNTYSNPPQPQAVHKWNTAPMNVPYQAPQPQTVYQPSNANVQYPSSQYSQPPTPLQPQIQSQPPPPPMSSNTGTSNMNSNTNSGSRPPSVGPLSKSKYIIDPSVKSSANNPPYGRGGFQQNQMYNAPSPGSMMGYPQQQNQYQPPPTYLNQEQEQTTPKMYDPIRTQPQSQTPNYGNPDIPYQPLPHSSGWNDPPTAKSSRAQAKAEQFQPAPAPAPAPILHPLGGVAPQVEPPTMQSESYYPDPVYGQQYSQNISNMPNMPNMPPIQNPASIQYNKPPIPGVPTATAATTTTVSPPSLLPPTRPVDSEKPKVPIPEQHLHLKTVFDELKSQCYENAKNPQTKRKIEDVSRKLENLYDCLREDKLSQNTLQGLHQISQLIQSGDYTGGLTLHTKLASGPDFSRIASFMPGIKVLLQSALQLGVFLR